MLPKTLLVCLLDLIAARAAFGWNHASRADLESSINTKKIVLVAFVAPWNEATKSLEPEWLSATSQTTTPLMSIDCTSESTLCHEHDVVSYPAIRVFNSPSMTRYKGARKADAITRFLKRAARPVVDVIDRKNITTFKESDSVAVVAYLDPSERTLISGFTEVAFRYHDKYAFGIAAPNHDLLLAEQAETLTVVVYKANGQERVVLDSLLGVVELERGLQEATRPVIGEFNRRNEEGYMKAGKSIVYYFARTNKKREKYAASMTPLAKKFAEYLSFVTVDAVEYGHMLPALGMKQGIEDGVAVFNPIYGQAFTFPGKQIEAQSIEAFVMEIGQGKVQPLGKEQDREHTEL